ncbi:MBL fold metallo-hydrolase [Reinekea sp.]|uniref:MBL fold metallo-hydrolase n=1 Tax=Reinekea sp. TaxID=1970455 RepID=UPI003988A2AA
MLKYEIMPVTAFAQNCSLLWCDETNEAVFVDAGGEADRLLAAVEAKGLTLTAIWLTHGHLDHAGGSQDIREQTQVPVIGPSKEDDFWLEGIEQQAQMYGLPGLRNVMPDRWLTHGDKLKVGNEELNVIAAPGHTPGHVIFHHPKQQLAWVGDVIFAGGIGRTDFPKGDYQTLINAIRQNLWPLGDDVKFIPGHGPESTFGAERQTNPFVADHLFN